MRISEVDRTRTAAAPRRKATAASEGAGFAGHLREAVQGSAERHPVNETVAISTVLPLEVLLSNGDRPHRQRALRHGHDILDQLEDLRLELLTGELSRSRLADLSNALASRTRTDDDPQLDALLDEIEMRAAVELAKLSAGFEPPGNPAWPLK